MESNKKIINLSVVAIILAIVSIFYTVNSTSSRLNWRVVQSEAGNLEIYLQGENSSKVAGADIKLYFDKNNYQVASVEAGGFFAQSLFIIKDNNNLSYSLMINPEDKVPNDPTKPIMKVHLVQNKVSGLKFYVLPSSQVYISKVGGAFPKDSMLILK